MLILKRNSGNFRGIGLLEVLWEVIEKVLDARLSSSELHDCLHGFRTGRGCGTGIMEAKLVQQLVFVEQCPLYGIFIDLSKVYDPMDRGRCLEILGHCGVGEKALRLIARFWRDAELVCRASGYYGRHFLAIRGVTQGGPLSPAIFNLMVDAIVRKWVRVLQEVHGMGLEDVRRLMTCFYADDGLIVTRNPEDLQIAFDVLTGLFDRVGLRTNTTKTEAMVFLPGKIMTPLAAESYEAQMDDTFQAERTGRRVNYHICHNSLAVGFLPSHLSTQHNIYQCFLIKDSQEDPLPPPRRLTVSFFPAEGKFRCPVSSCPQGREGHEYKTPFNLRWHFVYRHPRDEVVIKDTCLSQCHLCRM